MKKHIYCVTAIIVLIFSASQFSVLGQSSTEYVWAKGAGSTGADEAYGVKTDPDGNIYVTGYFSGTASFGDFNLVSAGDLDVFITKLDQNGNFLWAKKGGGANFDAGLSIDIDSSGNVYVAGRYRETVYFGPYMLTSDGGYSCNIFIVKLDTNGNWLWAKQAGGGGAASDRGYGLAIDSMANVYITGYIVSNAFFGDIELISQGGRDVFVAKMNSDGNFLWAVSAGGPQDDWSYDIALDDSGNIFITGDFLSTATFGHIQLQSGGSQDIFVAKLNNSGSFLWAKKAGGTGSNTGYRIAVDNSGNSYITGKFSGTAFFGTYELISSGLDDIFIAGLNNDGNYLWARKAGGTGNDIGYGIAVDTSGTVLVAGSFYDIGNFGSTQLYSSGLDDIFITALDSAGNFLWAEKAGGTGNDRAQSITIDSNKNLYLTGYFNGLCSFGNIQIQSKGNNDVFIAKLSYNAELVPVYRFFNTVRGGHLYTISEIERDYIIDNLPEWTYEGIKFYVWDNYAENTTAAYRFFNTITGIHLYTISEHERDVVMQIPEWNYEGVKFFVSPDAQNQNAVPVFRFFNHIRGGHLYTISEIERDYIIDNLPEWTYEGIPFYVINL